MVGGPNAGWLDPARDQLSAGRLTWDMVKRELSAYSKVTSEAANAFPEPKRVYSGTRARSGRGGRCSALAGRWVRDTASEHEALPYALPGCSQGLQRLRNRLKLRPEITMMGTAGRAIDGRRRSGPTRRWRLSPHLCIIRYANCASTSAAWAAPAVQPRRGARPRHGGLRERGCAGASLDDLTAAMELNRPSVHAAFGDKHALLLAALDRHGGDARAPALGRDAARAGPQGRDAGIPRRSRRHGPARTSPERVAGRLRRLPSGFLRSRRAAGDRGRGGHGRRLLGRTASDR
jgi:hypothetical protein